MHTGEKSTIRSLVAFFSKSERKNGVEIDAWEFGQGFISARSAIVNLAEKEALRTRCRSRLTTLTVLTVSGIVGILGGILSR
jgi:hypothetical protein